MADAGCITVLVAFVNGDEAFFVGDLPILFSAVGNLVLHERHDPDVPDASPLVALDEAPQHELLQKWLDLDRVEGEELAFDLLRAILQPALAIRKVQRPAKHKRANAEHSARSSFLKKPGLMLRARAISDATPLLLTPRRP